MPVAEFIIPRGIGGGGGLYGPAIRKLDPDDVEIFVTCDMSQVFRWRESESKWTVIDFNLLQAKPFSTFRFTATESILYSIDRAIDGLTEVPRATPTRSTDGGTSWTPYSPWDPNSVASAIFADPRPSMTQYLFVSDGKQLQCLDWQGGNPPVDPLPLDVLSGMRVAGAFFFDLPVGGGYGDVLIATDEKLFLSSMGGGLAPVTLAQGSADFGAEKIISFSGAQNGSVVTLFCVTAVPAQGVTVDAEHTIDNFNTATYSPGHAYVMEWVGGVGAEQAWTQLTLPEGASGLFRPTIVVTARANPNCAFVAATEVKPACPPPPCPQQLRRSLVYRLDYSLGMLGESVWGVANIFDIDANIDNAGIETGWGGATNNTNPQTVNLQATFPYDGQASFLTFTAPTGLAVDAKDANHLVLCCKAFIHRTTGALGPGAVTWEQIYLSPSHALGEKIEATDTYESVGMEPTVGTWIHWVDQTFPPRMRASFNDIASIRSADRGVKWSFDRERWETPKSYSGGTFTGDVFMTLHASVMGGVREFAIRGQMAAMASGPYSSQDTVTIDKVNGYSGTLHTLSEEEMLVGEIVPRPVWMILKSNFGGAEDVIGPMPVWLAIGPGPARGKPAVLYVAVAHSNQGDDDGIGGVWYCHDSPEAMNVGSQWTRVAETGPHPYNVRFLKNGTRMLVSQAAVFDLGTSFQPKSGVVVFDNPDPTSLSWIRNNAVVSDPGMTYWTQDVVVDPRNDDRWWACVWRHLNVASTTAGLYRTMTGGVGQWKQFLNGKSVTSCAVHPTRDEMYICTRYDGLWYGEDIYGNAPVFSKVDIYPFRAPMRVFYRRHQLLYDEIWVISNGNGMHQLVRTHRDIFVPLPGLALFP